MLPRVLGETRPPEQLERVRLLWNGSAEVPQGMLKDAKNLQTSKVAAK